MTDKETTTKEKLKPEILLISHILKRKRLLEFCPESNTYNITLTLEKPGLICCDECEGSIDPEEIFFCKDYNNFYHRDCLINDHKVKLGIFDSDHMDYRVNVIFNINGEFMNYDEVKL